MDVIESKGVSNDLQGLAWGLLLIVWFCGLGEFVVSWRTESASRALRPRRFRYKGCLRKQLQQRDDPYWLHEDIGCSVLLYRSWG